LGRKNVKSHSSKEKKSTKLRTSDRSLWWAWNFWLPAYVSWLLQYFSLRNFRLRRKFQQMVIFKIFKAHWRRVRLGCDLYSIRICLISAWKGKIIARGPPKTEFWTLFGRPDMDKHCIPRISKSLRFQWKTQRKFKISVEIC